MSPNSCLGDTVQRLTADISQGLGIRFGETIKSYDYSVKRSIHTSCLHVSGELALGRALHEEEVGQASHGFRM